ncbi:MAG TPA: CBS domain-containing protein [Thiotrichaceae bacterium]|nr:CBS domain-containing protein [Thiotrichaceae bacterium]
MITVKELMSRELYTLKPTDTLHQARDLMLKKQIRHIPIVDKEGKFVGLLTKRDVLAAGVSALADINTQERDELESSIPISEIMITDVLLAEEDTLLLEAARSMLKQKHGCLPVFRGHQLLGILTEADFVKLALYLMEKIPEAEKTQNINNG